MRDGFLENLNFTPPAYVNGYTLQYAACGERDIPTDKFISMLKFSGQNHTNINWLINVVQRFNSEERTALYKFITGRTRLPVGEDPPSLTIDNAHTLDMMPTASTCFDQLHLPAYSSPDKMYTLVRAAVLFTDSMEMH